MLSFLKNHPFGVEAFFERSTVLTFAFPKEELAPFLPAPLTLDTFDDKWAFIAVAMVQTKGLRPKGFPKFMGNDFFLIGYRIFVKYIDQRGKRLRGLYIIKSETNKKKMEFFGNIFTHYNYTTTDIIQSKTNQGKVIKSTKSAFNVSFHDSDEDTSLPEGSPFSTWKEARRYAGPLPFTFTYQAEKKEMLIIQGVKQNWKPRPFKVIDYQLPFLDELELSKPILANAFMIENIPYHWKKGKLELCNQ